MLTFTPDWFSPSYFTMQPQSLCFILFIYGIGIVGLIDGVCVVRNAIWPSLFWYQCTRSTDYLEDIRKAPTQLERISFTSSQIRLLQNSSFTRIGVTLQVVAVSDSGVKDIEDDAFKGLSNLTILDLSRNELEIVKGAWFADLPKLEFVDLSRNKINHVEDNVFKFIFQIDSNEVNIFDLSSNKLTCLPVSSMSNFKVQGFILTENPLTWKCISLLTDWKTANNISSVYLGGLEVTSDAVKSCMATAPTPDPEDVYVNTCVENALSGMLPSEENYTIEKLCQFSESKTSSYIKCKN